MIHRLNAPHVLGDFRRVLLKIALEVGLGTAGASNQDGSGGASAAAITTRNGLSMGSVPGPTLVRLAVDVVLRVVVDDVDLSCRREANAEQLGFAVIDPDADVGKVIGTPRDCLGSA